MWFGEFKKSKPPAVCLFNVESEICSLLNILQTFQWWILVQHRVIFFLNSIDFKILNLYDITTLIFFPGGSQTHKVKYLCVWGELKVKRPTQRLQISLQKQRDGHKPTKRTHSKHWPFTETVSFITWGCRDAALARFIVLHLDKKSRGGKEQNWGKKEGKSRNSI